MPQMSNRAAKALKKNKHSKYWRKQLVSKMKGTKLECCGKIPMKICQTITSQSLQRRLAKDQDLKTKYEQTISVDLEKNFVRKLDRDEIKDTTSKPQWYIPHHPVLNPHKPEKVRRVCNAAAKYNGVSLNDKLMPGPDLLNSLLGIIFRFREHPIALTADIESMFLQVSVPKEECRLLRFLWRESRDDPVTSFE